MAITAFYVFMHVPRDDHPELLRRIHRSVKPGDVFIAPMSTVGGPDRVESWLGVQMFFSGWDAETNGSLVRAAGLDCVMKAAGNIEQMGRRSLKPRKGKNQ